MSKRDMPRSLRIQLSDVTQHICHRGHNRGDIFRTDGDRCLYLEFAREAAERCQAEIHGYALMTNHIHFLTTPRQPTAIVRMMQTLGSRYARYFNRRYQRTGGVFEDRYHATIVDDERYWVACLRYIELNPVRAGIVKTADEYRWSSHQANAFGWRDPIVTAHRRYLELGATGAERQQAWRSMCSEALSTEELDRIRFAVFEQRVLGALAAANGPV